MAGDGTVQYKFLADVAQAEANLAKLERKLDSQENKLKQVSRTSRSSSKDTASAFQTTITKAGGAILALASVESAVKVVTTAYNGWAEAIKNASMEERAFSQNLIKTLTLTGDLAQGPEIKQRLQNIPGLTDEQAVTAFDAVTGAVPQFSLEQRLKLTEAVQPAAPLLTQVDGEGKIQGLEELAKFGTLVADLAEVSPGKSTDDLADLATSIRANLGKFSDQASTPAFEKLLRTLTIRGFTTEESSALGVEQLRSGGRATTLANAIAKLPADVDAQKSIADFGKNPERDEKLFGQEGVAELQRIRLPEVEKLRTLFNDAQAKNLLNQEVENARRLDPLAFAEQTNAADQEKSLRAEALSERQRAALAAFRYAQADTFGERFTAFGRNTGEWLESFAPGPQDFSLDLKAADALRRNPNDEIARQAMDGLFQFQKQPFIDRADDPQAAENQKLMQDTLTEQKRQTAILEKLAARPRTAPAPAINRNANTE